MGLEVGLIYHPSVHDLFDGRLYLPAIVKWSSHAWTAPPGRRPICASCIEGTVSTHMPSGEILRDWWEVNFKAGPTLEQCPGGFLGKIRQG